MERENISFLDHGLKISLEIQVNNSNFIKRLFLVFKIKDIKTKNKKIILICCPLV